MNVELMRRELLHLKKVKALKPEYLKMTDEELLADLEKRIRDLDLMNSHSENSEK